MMERGKKKILIIIEGMRLGGLSSSLLNFFSVIHAYPEIDIAVGLIDYSQRDRFPEDVEVLDLSCFNRAKNGKLQKILNAIKLGAIDTLKIRAIRDSAKYNSIKAERYMELIQKREMKQARLMKSCVDFTDSFDAVISWCEMYTSYLLAYKIRAKHKIVWIHPHYEQAHFSKNIDSKMLARVDAAVAVSKEGRDALVRSFPEYKDKFAFVYNKADIESIINKSLAENVSYEKETVNFITVARIQNISKAYDRTLRVMKRLKDEGHRFKWRIVGGGEDSESVKSQIAEYGLSDFVYLLGFNANPLPYVKASDAFLLCSRYEGLPVVIDEALILGTPPIVTEYAAAREQICDGVMGLIVPNTEDGVYNGILSVLRNKDRLRQIRENLKGQNLDRYKNCEDFLSLIDEVCR